MVPRLGMTECIPDFHVSTISPVSIDRFSPNFCHWCILGHRWPDYVFGSKGQSSRSHHRGGGAQHSTLPSSATFSSLVMEKLWKSHGQSVLEKRTLARHLIGLYFFLLCWVDLPVAAGILSMYVYVVVFLFMAHIDWLERPLRVNVFASLSSVLILCITYSLSIFCHCWCWS